MWDLLRQPTHIVAVDVEGMQLHIPPADAARGALRADSPGRRKPHPRIAFTISEIRANNVQLFIETSKPGKEPLEFDIDKLDLRHVGPSKLPLYTGGSW